MSKQKSSSSSSKTNGTKDKETLKPSKSSASIQRRTTAPPIVQNVILVWLDEKMDEKGNSFWRNAIAEFRHEINTIHTFTESDPCVLFLSKHMDEKICLIISGTLGQKIIPTIYNMSQVYSILIFCDNKKEFKRWAKNWTKIFGVFTHSADLAKALEEIVDICEQDSIGINLLSMNDVDAAKRDEDQMPFSFVYPSILKEILLTISFDDQRLDEFIDYCRGAFNKNDQALHTMKEFKRTYKEKTPIEWFAQNSLLYSMINRALRLLDLQLLMKLDFFLIDLHRQIEQLSAEQYRNHDNEQSVTFYRGQGLSKADFDRLAKLKGGFMSLNNFLFANTDSKEPLNIARDAAENPDLIGVLFHISANPSKAVGPFASISKVISLQSSDDNILLSMFTIFRIGKMKQIDGNNRLWQIDLTLATNDDSEIRIPAAYANENTNPNSKGWGRLGIVLIKMSELEKARQVYKTMLEQTSDGQQRAGIYHQLGWIEDRQGHHEQSISFYKKALEVSLKSLPADHPDLAMSYNNIGLVYYTKGDYSKALSAHQKALAIRQKTLPANHPDLAMSNNNIGMVHVNMENYAKAASFCERAVQIGMQALPPNHIHLQHYREHFDLVKKKL
ncbi:unnamed protein product [Adineta ricciae]|uniref:Uncharacterized protein n=1 Tax=Adineta ricciae TaxID=249248 RepID=A0A814RHA5_ADIRI|nr:unnamed protein product [Adineta ricciae]CAF1218238.1 unnamed protein product [Adineta ricciae]